MRPIDRVRARAEALAALELGYYASDEEIRAAWHRIALACHPDRDRSQTDRFTRAKLARDFLMHEGRRLEEPEARPTRVVPRRVVREHAAAGCTLGDRKARP